MQSIENIQNLLINSRFNEAKECIDSLDDTNKLVWKGWLTVYESGLEEGESFCVSQLQRSPTNHLLWSVLGWIYWEQGHPHKAMVVYERSLSIAWSQSAYLNAVSVICELGLISRVQELMDEFEDNLQFRDLSSPELDGYLLCKAIVAREHGRAPEALQLLNSIGSQTPEVFILRGHIYQDEFLYTQAMMSYQKGLDIFPMHPVLLNDFQRVLQHLPSIPKGVHSLLSDQPDSLEAFLKVRAYLERIRADLLERDADSPEVQHLSAALHGRNPPQPPDGYVEELFDDYAERFESHLIEKLDYQVPQLIASVVNNRFTPEQPAVLSWDLGCGTGLLGPQLGAVSKRLVGVDISGKMLRRAREKGTYDDLIHGDIVSFLSEYSGVDFPDLIVVADTLVYIGDLRPFLFSLSGCMNQNTQVVCTIERVDGVTSDGFQLTSSGRYAHSIEWVHWLLPQYGLTVKKQGEVVLRQGGGTWVRGWLLIIEQDSQL